jgi:hypothetical protein
MARRVEHDGAAAGQRFDELAIRRVARDVVAGAGGHALALLYTGRLASLAEGASGSDRRRRP